MKICNIGKIITAKIDGATLTHDNYISTENMMSNCGGVVAAASVPSTKVTCFAKCDVLLSNIRPYFKKVWFARFNGGCSNDVICIRANEKDCLAQYLYYALSTDSFIDSFSASSKGTKMPRGDKNALLSYEISDRTIDEQQHIVDILGTLDEKIENNEKNIALMLQLCKEKFSLLSSQSNIKTTLKNLCEFAICGTTPSTKAPELWNGNIPFITTPDMNNKVFVFDTERTVAYSDKIKSKLISEDSISVSCIGTIGVIGMATELSLTNQQINTLIPRTNQKYYLYNLLLANIDAIKAIATGSATPNISKESFLKLDVYVCSEKDICSFNEDVTPIYETIKKLQIENRKIKELKQLYLKKFFG